MPIYEYGCNGCNARFQKLVRGFSDPVGLQCPRCESLEVKRVVSRFAMLKSEEARFETLADPGNFAGLDESDPRSIARWAKKMGKELGEDAGEDWEQLVDEMLEEELGDEGDKKAEGDPAKKPAKSDNLGWG